MIRIAAVVALVSEPVLAGDPQVIPPAAARVIYLLRHGAYTPDPKADRLLGPGLAPIGVAQARLVGARLSALPFRFDAIYASPLTRALETARVVAADLPGAKIEILPDLEECTPPTWRIEVVADSSPEEMAACAQRLDRLFARLFIPAQGSERRELLVCHGDVIRYLVTKALRVDTKAWLEMSVRHASLTVVRVEPDGRFKVITIGDTGHLPPSLLSGATGDPERDLAVPAE
ncbi:MAG: histidine phosphatase family protein [Acidobacteriota bacterium]